MNSLESFKIIGFLTCVLILTSILGEFYRTQPVKEGLAQLIGMFIKIFTCFFTIMNALFQLLLWGIMLLAWFPLYIIWLVQNIMCAITRVLNLPKCFLWYGMDIAGKIFYLPFHCLFWVLDSILGIGVVNMEYDLWTLLEQMDKYIHDDMGTGYHIIHFPDSAQKLCYTCKIGKFPKMLKEFPMSDVMAMANCISG